MVVTRILSSLLLAAGHSGVTHALAQSSPLAAAGTSLLSVGSSSSRTDAIGDIPTEVPDTVLDLLCPYAPEEEALRKTAFTHLLGAVRDADNQTMHGRPPTAAAEDVSSRIRNARSCAVVSNSGVLLQHQHGDSIDDEKHDLVFRFNDAPIGGDLRRYVGAREDVRILNFKLSVWGGLSKVVDAPPKESYISPNTTTKFPIIVSRRDRVLRDPEKVGKRMLKDIFGHDGSGAQTTGLEGLLLCMIVCDQVWAYGFPHTANSVEAPFHYFGELKTGSASENPVAVHAKVASFEKRLFGMLSINAGMNASDVAVIPGFRSLRCPEQTVTGQSHDL
mmetsp:Transcript_23604/g.54971  ORF Transcript_23604/g.54971 Transcript_23604/m.54971 type:complete len:333 (-) Transcript_23604:32-1030(-)